MDQHYLIFHQAGFDFALDPEEYSPPLSMRELEISSSQDQGFAWQFTSSNPKAPTGHLLHFGQLLGLSPLSFSKGGQVFFFQQKDKKDPLLGLYIENTLGYLDKSSLKAPRREITAIKRLPPKMPTTALGWYLPWRGRKFLLVEAKRIFAAFTLSKPKPLAG